MKHLISIIIVFLLLSSSFIDVTAIFSIPSVQTNTENINSLENNEKEIGLYLFDTDNSWWNNDFLYRKKITIDHTKISENLTNFPVLIYLDSDSDLAFQALDDGSDIVFIDQNNIRLNHEIESFNDSSGSLICWVNITGLSSTKDTTLYMYYGNPTWKSSQNKSNVWDSNFILVYHLSEASGLHNDSTSNNNNGFPFGGVIQDTTGQIDGADLFDGIDGYIESFIDCGNTTNTTIVGSIDGAHNVVIDDVDDDEINDLIVCGYRANKVVWYKQLAATTWSEYLIDNNLLNAHDIQVGDIDDDGKDDVVGLSLSENPYNYNEGNGTLIWYQKPDNPTESWNKTIIATSGQSGLTGSRSSGLGDIDSDGDLDIAVAVDACTYQTNGRLYWYQNPGGSDATNGSLWNEYLIDDTQNNGCDSQIGDLDNDGNPDIVFSCHVISPDPYGVILYFAPDDPQEAGNWERVDLSTSASYHNYIVDFDGDGHLDILVAHWTSYKISWYKNPGSDIRNVSKWVEYIIDYSSAGIENTNRIIAYDIDLDGDLDVATVSDPNGSTGWLKWYQRPDDPTNVSDYVMHVVDSDPSRTAWAHDGDVGDIDGDGTVDMVGVGCNSNKVFVDYNITVPSPNVVDGITVEAWTYWNALGATSVGVVGKYETPAQTGYALGKLGSETTLSFYPVGGSTYCAKTTSHIPLRNFVHYVGTYNGSDIKIYKNGFLENSTNLIGNVPTNIHQPLVIGRWYGNYNGYYFDGIIDEVRISKVARSAGWINTSYMNQQDPQSFITMGEQEIVPVKLALFMGKIVNLTTIGEIICFDASNLRIIQFLPFSIQKFTSGERIVVFKPNLGILTKSIAFGLFRAAV